MRDNTQVHFAGTVTMGCTLIIMGVLFIVHIIVPGLSYAMIFRLWPLILVGLGIEVLIANAIAPEKMKFSGISIAILLIMVFFSMIMAGCDILMNSHLPEILCR